jgi:cell wall-associated NlpC family hydrolase
MDSPIAFMPPVKAACLPLTFEREAELRKAVIAVAMTWEHTPYRDQGSVMGGAIDCAMLLVNSWVGAGVFEPFDPRPYPPSWHLHHSQERYLEWLETIAREVEVWRPGDLVVWQFAHCFSHGGIIINEQGHVVHALKEFGKCTVTDMDEAFLSWIGKGRKVKPRPRKFFDVWAAIRDSNPPELA